MFQRGLLNTDCGLNKGGDVYDCKIKRTKKLLAQLIDAFYLGNAMKTFHIALCCYNSISLKFLQSNFILFLKEVLYYAKYYYAE